MIDHVTVEQYLGEISRCTTLNEFNRVHIQIEIHCSPAEVCAIIDAVRERGIPLLPNLQRWHAIMNEQLRGGGAHPQPYVRTRLTPGAAMYAAAGTPEERAHRTLVIAFTGIADRLMMPVSSFLQQCPAEAYDFLVLFDRSRRFFFGGIAGFGNDLPSSAAAIRARVAPSRYRRSVSFGTSGGGLAAVWAAVELGLDRAISVGGTVPNEIGLSERVEDFDASDFVDAVRRHADRLPEVVYVAGELANRDVAKGQSMQQCMPTTLLIIPGCDNHNTLHFLRRRGELQGLLARLLGDERVVAAAPVAESR